MMRNKIQKMLNLGSLVGFPLLLALFAFIFVQDLSLYRRLLSEDHIVEWLTVTFFVLSAVLSLALALQIRKQSRNPLYYWFFVLLALACLFSALEEISWGQRILDLELDTVTQLSDQGEINVHNVLQGELDFKTKDAIGLVLFLYGFCLPWVAWNDRVADFFDHIGFVVPPRVLSWGFLLAALMMFDVPTGDEEEIGEFFMSLGFFLLFVFEQTNLSRKLNRQRDRLRDGDPYWADLRARWTAITPSQVLTQYGHVLALLVLVAGFGLYMNNLDAHITESNEGSYLYAAWRISEGEIPYRDLLTPQLPLFLYTGAALIKLFGPAVEILHLVTILLILASAYLLYLTGRRLVGAGTGLAAMIAFLLYPDVYKIGWMYRPDPYMLFFAIAGLALFVWADGLSHRRRWGLALAGFVFGLGVLTKLFGALPLAGCAAFTIYRALLDRDRDKKDRVRQAGLDLVALLAPAMGIVAGVLGLFYLITPEVYVAVLGHHLMQGQDQGLLAAFAQGLTLYWIYLQGYATILIFSLPLALWTLIHDRGRHSLLAWYLLTALGFVLLSRELWSRHLVYLAPAVCLLFAWSLKLLRSQWATLLLSVAIVGAVIIPWYQQDRALSRQWAVDDWQLADFIRAHTTEDEFVLTDFSELNFYAQRKTTYAGASITGGAASSGQITGRQLIEEMAAQDVKMVVLSTAGDADHKFLLDVDEFLAHVRNHYDYLGSFTRHSFPYDVYVARDTNPAPSGVNFGNTLNLLSAGAPRSFKAGQFVDVRVRCQALGEMDDDYSATVFLRDSAGHQWTQVDGPLVDAQGARTSRWRGNALNVDRFFLWVPFEIPPGTYEMWLGLYRGSDMARLNVLGPAGNTAGTEYPLGSVTLERPTIPPAAEKVGIANRQISDLTEAVRLLGYREFETNVRAGETIPLSLFWEGRRNLDTDFQVRLALLDANGQRLAPQRFPPAGETFGTSQWRNGEIVAGRYGYVVEAMVPGGTYSLVVNWVDPDTNTPLAAADVMLGTIQVLELDRTFEVPQIAQPQRADLGSQIALLGYDLDQPSLQAGGALNLTLYWQARTQVSASYTVFTHMIDGQERIWAQQDSIPAAGTRPTTGWLPGEIIVDSYQLAIDAAAPAGEYQLAVGLYDARNGERLPVSVNGLPVAGDRVLLDTILTVGP